MIPGDILPSGFVPVSPRRPKEEAMKLKYTLLLIFILMLLAANAQNAAISFDGAGDYATFPSMLNAGLGGASGFTFESWIKPASLANGVPVDGYRNTVVEFTITGSNTVLSMYLLENGKIRFGGRSRNLDAFQDVLTTNPVIATDTWQHVAGVLDFTNKKIFLYVDGVLVASKEVGVLFGSNTFFPATGGVRYIGSGSTLNSNHFFHGSMDEMRLWTIVRTQQEIQENMEYPVSTQPYLLGYWKFDNDITDSSGYGFDGTLIGNTSFGDPYLSGLYIYVVPVYSEVYEDDYVELEIRVEGFQDPMRAYEIALQFDSQYLRLETPEDIRKGDLLSAHGTTQLLSFGSGGDYTVTESILGVSTGATGSGSLFIIRLKTLQSTDEEGTPFALTSAILRGPLNEDINVADLLGSTIVIEARPPQTHIIPLHTGWNLVSSWIVPLNASMEAVFAQLILDGYLIKVQDEFAYALVYDETQGWINTIGDFQNTEGYYVQVSSDCYLEVTGYLVDLPMTVTLQAGWNIIPYPYLQPEMAMSILEPFVSSNTLVKVQDEDAASIVFDNGAWIDNIVEFESGEGYYINVVSNTQIDYLQNRCMSEVNSVCPGLDGITSSRTINKSIHKED